MRPPRTLTVEGLRSLSRPTTFTKFPTQPPRFPLRQSQQRFFADNFRSKLRDYATSDFPPRNWAKRHPFLTVTARLAVSTVLGLGVLVGAILIHDATTYSERHTDRVPANPLSLHPRTGGKKNLPILEVLLDDEEDDAKRAMKDKPRLVIVGGGWGVSVLSDPYPRDPISFRFSSDSTPDHPFSVR